MGMLKNLVDQAVNYNPDASTSDGSGGMVSNLLYQAARQKQRPEYMAKGGKVRSSKPKQSSASKRGDGIAQRGKTRGKMV